HPNTATATGTDDEGSSASAQASATINYTNVAPSISVSKTASVASVQEGGVGSQTVTYTYTLQNTSQASTDPLTVVLTDTDGTPTYVSGDANSNGVLDKGETWTYKLTVTVPTQN